MTDVEKNTSSLQHTFNILKKSKGSKEWWNNNRISVLRIICVLPVILIYCFAISIVFDTEPIIYLVFIVAGILGSFFAMTISWGNNLKEYCAIAIMFVLISICVFIIEYML